MTLPHVIKTERGLSLDGHLVIAHIESIDWHALAVDAGPAIDISGVIQMDTAGAWAIIGLERAIAGARITGATDPQLGLLDTVRTNMPLVTGPIRHHPSTADRLERYGRYVIGSIKKTGGALGFLGAVIVAMATTLRHPGRLRITSLVHHMQEVGLNAVPIVSLMSFLIGVVVAFQGAVQLRQFGAEIFVVDLIAISVLRELGILLTAIIVAGRSGSAFTAAIGSMKMREEIDAMRTLGLDPIVVLVVPRVMALILMLPVLGVISDAAGLIGGGLMSWIELGVSPAVFQSRLVSNTEVWHLGVGLIKAPVFALIIGVVGCFEGMRVEPNAESLGRLTSASVVVSIFMVIVADALFSVFFAIVGV